MMMIRVQIILRNLIGNWICQGGKGVNCEGEYLRKGPLRKKGDKIILLTREESLFKNIK